MAGLAMAEDQVAKARETLLERLGSLHELFGRNVLTPRLLGRQLVQLVSSEEARVICADIPAKELEARRLLMRMSDPERWRSDSQKSEDERKKLFPGRLVEVFRSKGEPSDEMIDAILDTANLPFFVGFVKDERGENGGQRKNSRVSVLD
jgi:hypothetical protein